MASLENLELRSANNLLQALALTQSDQTRMLIALETTVAEHGERLGRIEGGVQQILALLNRLITPDDQTGIGG